MNPSYGIIAWIAIGALTGWLASKIVGTGERGPAGKVVLGAVGAIAGGVGTELAFGPQPAAQGRFVASLLVALLGAIVLIAVVTALAELGRRRRHAL